MNEYEQLRNRLIPLAERMANFEVPIQATEKQEIEWGAAFLRAMAKLWEEFNRDQRPQ
mgnify:CR=1 FL=1